MKNVKFEFYDKREFEHFIFRLPSKDMNKLLLIIADIENLGMLAAIKMKWVKKLKHNLYEIRSRRSNNIQRCLYFHVVNNQYLITNYFTKKTNKTPANEIRKAIKRRNKYFKEKGGK